MPQRSGFLLRESVMEHPFFHAGHAHTHTHTRTRTRRRTLTCVSERGVTSGLPPLSKRDSVNVRVFLSQNFMTVQNHRLSELERIPEMILFKSFLCKN